MKRAVLVTMICFLLLTSMAVAQSVDGEWTTGLRTRSPDEQPIMLTLNSDGSQVTGTVHGIQPIPLEGTIDGNTLNLELTVTTSNGGDLLVHYTAILEGDELKFMYQSETGRPPIFGPAAQEFTATRLR